MSHSTRRSVGRASSGRRHPSKEMLLPMTRQAVSDISLANHLALAVCRKGLGNAHQLNELIRAVYLTYCLQQSGFGDAPVDLYRRAETALDQAGVRGQCDGVWAVSVEVAGMLEEILAIHDLQLMSVATRDVMEAKARLSRFSKTDLRSPISDDAQTDHRRDDVALDASLAANGLQ
jgi:hypothetical protein